MITAPLEASWASAPLALGPNFLDPQRLIDAFGAYAVVGVVAIVFIETGLLFPLLPGDSLLFTAGALVAQGVLDTPLWLLCTVLFAAAFAGDQNAYLIGRRVGPRLFHRPDSRVFKQQHLLRAHEFFAQHGGKAVVLARFVPFIRTYSAVTAGIGRMPYRTFMLVDLLGAALWAGGVTLLGYWLGRFSLIKDNIELLLVLVVLVSVVPIVLEVLRQRRKSRAATAPRAQATSHDLTGGS